MKQMAVQPFSERFCLCVSLFDLIIIDDLFLLRVDHEDLARMEPLLLHDMPLIQLQDADFGSEDHSAVIHHIISGWPQSVPVQNSTHQVPVRKYDGGRSVPWLHHRRVVLVKIPFLL